MENGIGPESWNPLIIPAVDPNKMPPIPPNTGTENKYMTLAKPLPIFFDVKIFSITKLRICL